MNLKGIISISGKPGLFKVVSQGKNSLIVESLIDKKRFPAFAANKISALDDISMYTEEEDVPLAEVVQKIYDKENGAECSVANGDAAAQHDYFEAILPNYDKERVYNSDLKKLYNWYNLLQSSGELTRILEEEKKAEEEAAKEKKPAKKTTKAKEETAAEGKEKKESKEKKETKAKKPKVDSTEKKKSTGAKSAGTKTNSKAKSTVRTASTKRGA